LVDLPTVLLFPGSLRSSSKSLFCLKEFKRCFSSLTMEV
jgi:hypothetical protein